MNQERRQSLVDVIEGLSRRVRRLEATHPRTRPRASVTHSQIIPNNTLTTIEISNGTVDEDDGFISGDTFVAPFEGRFDVFASGEYAAVDAGDFRQIRVTVGSNSGVDEVSRFGTTSAAAHASAVIMLSCGRNLHLASGATVTMQAFHLRGANSLLDDIGFTIVATHRF